MVCAALFLSSCKNQDAEIKNSLLGTWDVYASEINHKPNGFMKDAYFVFSADNLVNSNLFAGNQSPSYRVKNGRLIIDSDEKINLNIGRLDTDTMYLDGKVSLHYMEYFLAKRK